MPVRDATPSPPVPPASAPRRRLHYGWVVAGIAFLAVMLPAAVRGVQSILFVPLEAEFGWPRSVGSAAAALSMLLFGLLGPFAASWMQRVGIRRVMLGGLLLLAVAMAAAPFVADWRAFVLVWGVFVGLGAGVLGMVLGGAVINRWFLKGRGFAMGLLSAGIATVQLVVLPPAALAVRDLGWRVAVWGVAAFVLLILAVAWRWMRDSPAQVGLLRVGETEPDPAPPAPRASAVAVLGGAARMPVFWLLAVPFFVCGLSTGGLIAIHLVPASIEHGVPDVRAALLLSTVGVFDFVGALGSGFLTDRFSNGRLLAAYYGTRGLSLLALPTALAAGVGPLTAFAMVYGLGWVATVPPTQRLCATHFGPERGSVVFGWVFAIHQVGAAVAAFGAGVMRDLTGSYTSTFFAVAGMTLVAGALSLLVPKRSADGSSVTPRPAPVPPPGAP